MRARLRSSLRLRGLTAVVKANAYGHGLVPVARALAPHAARLCVYALEEAVALRDAGIDAPIHVLGPVPADELDIAHAANVQLTLWDRELYARQVASVARRRRRNFAVHAKIDTGVVRLGLSVDEAPAVLQRYATTPEFELRGAFTHLAAAEELDSTFTLEQTTRFFARDAGARCARGTARRGDRRRDLVARDAARRGALRDRAVRDLSERRSRDADARSRARARTGAELAHAHRRAARRRAGHDRRLRADLARRAAVHDRDAADRLRRRAAAQRRQRGAGAGARDAASPSSGASAWTWRSSTSPTCPARPWATPSR